MIVKIINREANPWNPKIELIKISDTCPACGGPRGKPYNYHFCEDGEWYSCDRWENPCGHIDHYKAVLLEARKGRGSACDRN